MRNTTCLSIVLLALGAGCNGGVTPGVDSALPLPDLRRPIAFDADVTPPDLAAVLDFAAGPDLAGCRADGDCKDAMAPRCDVGSGRCVPCLPMNDNCPMGRVCAPVMGQPGQYECAVGCQKLADCTVPDGGNVAPNACCKGACVDTTSSPLHCGACGNACAMGEGCCNARCVDTQQNNVHCGACNQACTLPNASGQCILGKCTLGRCGDGFGDCDQNPANGCEVNLNTDAANCTACAMTCVVAHGKAACAMGCTVASCDAGYADCDKDPKNGCEVDLSGDLKHCGACGAACANVANGTPACGGGKCVIGMCNQPFGDCNQDPADGCETDTSKALKHCGVCGSACPDVANGSNGCSAGKCGIDKCAPGFADCDMDPKSGCEINLTDDVANCGVCGMKCTPPPNGSASCKASVCVIGGCGNPFKDCDNNPMNGCEVDTSENVNHCGGCGMKCPAVPNGMPTCNLGKCAILFCNAPFKDCNNNLADGCETNTGSDASNCGGCGIKCSIQNGVAGCQNSTCVVASCNAGYKDCKNGAIDGCETNVGNDLNNCGNCNAKCAVANGTPGCANGACNIAACGGTFRDCVNGYADGCETNVVSNQSNCGQCGKVCGQFQNCVNSACAGVALIGSYTLGEGITWTQNPPTYTCQEACAKKFGALAAQYQCSTVNNSVNRKAWVDGYANTQYCPGGAAGGAADTFKKAATYNCGSNGCSYSALVRDNCPNALNYCFR